jgi:hypothetical protein
MIVRNFHLSKLRKLWIGVMRKSNQVIMRNHTSEAAIITQ